MNKQKNKKMINVNEKSTKDIKMKRIVEKIFLKKKENFNIIIFKIVDLKSSNAEIFLKYHIDDTITISSNFTKFFFEFENFSKEEDAAQTHKKEQKKI